MSYISGNTVPSVGTKHGIGAAFGIGAILNIFSFVISLILIKIDQYAVKHDKQIIDKGN